MTEESCPAARAPEWVLAALLCMAGALLVLWDPLVGDTCTLSFDDTHPGYPAPWVQPDGGPWPLINPITPDGDFLALPGTMRLAQLEEAGLDPWWDRSQLLGYPLGANQIYPLYLPYAAWLLGSDPLDVYDWLLWFHMALAGFGAYRAVRVLRGSATGGALAAVGFALSTWMITRWHLPQITYTTACWPGLVVAVEWLRRGKWSAGIGEAGVWIGLAIVAGFPQVGMLYLLGFLLLVALDRRLWHVKPILSAVLGAAVGLGLAAPLLNSVSTVYPEAARASERSKELAADKGMQPAALLGAVLPEFYGRPSDFATQDPPAPTMQAYLPRRMLLRDDIQDNPVEDALYPGVLLLLLVPLLFRRGVDPRARQLGLVAGLSVLGALLLPVAIELIPGLKGLASASPKRAIVLSAGCLPLAAAFALDALRRGAVRPALWPGIALVLLSGGLVLAVALLDEPDAPAYLSALSGQAARQVALAVVGTGLLWLAARGIRWAAPLAIVILFIDLVTLAWAFNPFPPQFEHFGPRPSLTWLAERPGRVAVVGQRRVLPPSAAGLHGIRSLHGSMPMLGLRTAELIACIDERLVDWRDPHFIDPFRSESQLDHPVLDLLEVRTVVHADPDMAARRGEPNLYESIDEGLAAFDRPSGGPRAFLSGGARVITDREQRLAWLSRPDAPVHGAVLLEADPGFPLPAIGPMMPIEPTVDLDGRIALDFEAPYDGIVVMVESWHPDWRAWLDGRPVELNPVHHALLGVPVRAGVHRLEFAFHMPHQRTARAVQALAVGVILLGVYRGLKRRWPRSD